MQELELLQESLSKIRDLCSFVETKGFYLCLVGGSVRDFLIERKLPFDLDFELRANIKKSLEEIDDLYQQMARTFSLEIEELPFHILRFSYSGFSFEMAPARSERYEKNWQELGHKNFKAHIDTALNYKDSFQRRDFTINAIGVEWRAGQVKLVDPYDGMKDLQEKKLRPCSDDFHKDPVRLLRALRFEQKLGFTFVSEQKFNLKSLSNFHFLSEFFKANSWRFLQSLVSYARAKTLSLPFTAFNHPLADFAGPCPRSKEALLFVLMLTQKGEMAALESLAKYLQLSKASLELCLHLCDLSEFKISRELLEQRNFLPHQDYGKLLSLASMMERPLFYELIEYLDEQERGEIIFWANKLQRPWKGAENFAREKQQYPQENYNSLRLFCHLRAFD